jgi:hypothetical protein
MMTLMVVEQYQNPVEPMMTLMVVEQYHNRDLVVVDMVIRKVNNE